MGNDVVQACQPSRKCFDEFTRLLADAVKEFGDFSAKLFSVEEQHLFNKIAFQRKGPDGKWTRKPLAYRESNILIYI